MVPGLRPRRGRLCVRLVAQVVGQLTGTNSDPNRGLEMVPER